MGDPPCSGDGRPDGAMLRRDGDAAAREAQADVPIPSGSLSVFDEDQDRLHPEDRGKSGDGHGQDADLDEEDRYRAAQVDAAMRMPALGSSGGGGGAAATIKLPPASFDSGRSTGVKGVIADARSYEMARQTKWIDRVRQARRSVFGLGTTNGRSAAPRSESSSGDERPGSDADSDEESFLQQWRESRRRELEDEARAGVVRSRRTSPSLRVFGRFDEVDALGYLDAIEKVGRESVVVVFVYDSECQVSAVVEAALRPLVAANPTIHFVRVHYEDIEFDNAAVPAVLAYRNQGDLFANLTGIVEMIPDNEDFDSDSLKRLFESYRIL
ncbi:hypothetical protein RB594_001404 [Gaeumannomyces avenae]